MKLKQWLSLPLAAALLAAAPRWRPRNSASAICA